MEIEKKELIKALRLAIQQRSMPSKYVQYWSEYLKRKSMSHLRNKVSFEPLEVSNLLYMKIFIGGIDSNLKVSPSAEPSYIKKNRKELLILNDDQLWYKVKNYVQNQLDKLIPGKVKEQDDLLDSAIALSDTVERRQARSLKEDQKRLNKFLDNLIDSERESPASLEEFCQEHKRYSKIILLYLKRKYEDMPLISRWLEMTFQVKKAAFEAVILPKEVFLQSLFLKYGSEWELTIAKEAVKAETAKRLAGKTSENRRKIVEEIKDYYREYFPQLTSQQVRSYFKPENRRIDKILKNGEIDKSYKNLMKLLYEYKQE